MFMEIRLKRIRAKQQKKLSNSYLALYKNITSYIHMSELNGLEKEKLLQEILDMMLQTQFEGKSIDSTIGKDYEVFCDSIIDEYTKNQNNRILNAFQNYVKYVLLGSLILALTNGFSSQSLSSLDITISQFIIINSISIFVIPMAKEIKKKRISAAKYQKYYTTISGHKGIYALTGLVFFPMLLKTILERFYGKEVLVYRISLFNGWYYVIIAIITIVLIEIYKRARYSN